MKRNSNTEIETPVGPSRKRYVPSAWGPLLACLPVFFFALSVATLSCTSTTVIHQGTSSVSSQGIYVPGPGTRPQFIFACCDQGKEALRFADPTVFADLKELHAGLAVPIDDLSPDRAQLIHRLNEAGLRRADCGAGVLCEREQCSSDRALVCGIRQMEQGEQSALGCCRTGHRARLQGIPVAKVASGMDASAASV